jgi:hypothetical protein
MQNIGMPSTFGIRFSSPSAGNINYRGSHVLVSGSFVDEGVGVNLRGIFVVRETFKLVSSATKLSLCSTWPSHESGEVCGTPIV